MLETLKHYLAEDDAQIEIIERELQTLAERQRQLQEQHLLRLGSRLRLVQLINEQSQTPADHAPAADIS